MAKTRRKKKQPRSPARSSRATPPRSRFAEQREKEQEPARTQEVLERALELIAERGVAGASLRALAKELGMSQPSLYHYFPSKSALVTAIVEQCAQRMVDTGLELPLPKTPLDIPGFVRDSVLRLYATDDHPRFVRFLFAVAIESPENRAIIARVFAERLDPSFDLIGSLFPCTPEQQATLAQVAKMVVYSLGFMLLEERALLGKPRASKKVLAYADWVVEAAQALVKSAGLGAPSGSRPG